MAERDGAAIGIEPLITRLDAECTRHRENLGREGLVELDHVEIGELEAVTFDEPGHGRHRAHAHDARRHAGARRADDARQRLQAIFLDRLPRGDEQGGGAIIDARGIAGRHRALFAERCRQFRQFLDRGAGAGMFIGGNRQGVAFSLRDRDGDDLLGKAAALLRPDGARLALGGIGILIGARDLVLGRDILRRLRHGLDAILRLHQRVDEAPADRRVVDFGTAREGRLRFGHHEGRPRHGFDAARDHEIGFARLDLPCRRDHRIEARRAQPVDRQSRHGFRQARQQGRHARHIAVVLARLVGAAQDHFIDRRSGDCRLAPQERADGHCGEIVGAHR